MSMLSLPRNISVWYSFSKISPVLSGTNGKIINTDYRIFNQVSDFKTSSSPSQKTVLLLLARILKYDILKIVKHLLPKHSLNHFAVWYKFPQRKILLIKVINLVRQCIKRYATVNSLISVERIIHKYSYSFPRLVIELEKCSHCIMVEKWFLPF